MHIEIRALLMNVLFFKSIHSFQLCTNTFYIFSTNLMETQPDRSRRWLFAPCIIPELASHGLRERTVSFYSIVTRSGDGGFELTKSLPIVVSLESTPSSSPYNRHRDRERSSYGGGASRRIGTVAPPCKPAVCAHICTYTLTRGRHRLRRKRLGEIGNE